MAALLVSCLVVAWPIALGGDGRSWLWWLAICGPFSGALAAGPQRRFGFLLVLTAWGLAWCWVFQGSRQFSFFGGLGAALGLPSLGFGWVRVFGRSQPLRTALGIAGVGALLIALPAGFWLQAEPIYSPSWTASLLLLSPASLALESAGVDFLRLPSVYGPMGADALGPDLWIAWGSLAGWGALVVGCGLALFSARVSSGGSYASTLGSRS